MFAKVIVDIAHSAVDRLFTYAIPEKISVCKGHRVLVPFGNSNKMIEGFVLDVMDVFDEAEAGGRPLKTVVRTMEPYSVLTDEQIELAYWIRTVYRCLLLDALRLMIPPEMRGGKVKEKITRTLRIADGVDAEAALQSLNNKDGKSKAPKQSEVLELLKRLNTSVSMADFSAFLPGASSAVRALTNKGYVVVEGHTTFRNPFVGVGTDENPDELPLTNAQNDAYEAILAAMELGRGTLLLHGVTGSGKTEVYMHAIAAAIKKGGTAIVLVPEIALTPQAMQRFTSRFGKRVAVLHSRLSPGERFDEWRRIRTGLVDVVIGARSAVFAPLENIRLIVVDEEHEHTYQSEMTPRYNALEVAAKRARLTNAALLLGSATPSVTSYRRAKSGRYKLLQLKERINEMPLPHVKIADMRNEFAKGNNSIFSDEMYSALKHCFDNGEQAILFMNRRGYSTFVSCRGCGYVFKCLDCDVSMTYHKLDDMLKCHYCGKSMRVPKVCPDCGKAYIKYFGIGTQQIEEQLREYFPGVSALRMDLDTTRTKNAHHDILAEFSSGKAQVLIGTQMVAKGLDIPNVTLVGVIAADATLHIPDYRSCERTFQLLTQVAGRAGRRDKKGQVVIQTYTPEHPAIQFAAKHDYESFFDYELAVRRGALFPPFSLFVRVLFSGKDENELFDLSEKYCTGVVASVRNALLIKGADERELLMAYASPSPIRKREGLFRYQVLLKLARTKNTAHALGAVYAYHDAQECAQTAYVEINPGDMF